MSNGVQSFQRSADEAFGRTAPGGAVLAAKQGRVLWTQGFGLADLTSQEPITADTRFLIGSVSKQFTAMLILMLVEKGKLGLEDSVSRYFPSFPAYADSITLRHLLTHTSGIQEYLVDDFWNDPDHAQRDMDVQEVLEMIQSYTEPYFEAGTAFSYCNSAYVLLGRIIEQVSGDSFADCVTQKLLTPAGMDRTVVGLHPHIAIPDLAKGYQKNHAGEMIPAPYTMATIGWADGNLISTVGDLYRWQMWLKDHPPVSPEWMREWVTPYRLKNGISTGYAMGWFVHTRRGIYETWHSGGTQGYTARFSRFPDQDAAVIILTNYETSPRDWLTGQIARILFENEMAPLEGSAPPAQVCAAMAGTYKTEKNETEVCLENGSALTAKSPLWAESGAVPVLQLAPGQFRLDSPHEYLLYEDHTDSNSYRLILDANGRKVPLAKVNGV